MELTQDAFLGGKLQIWQPARGYRAGVDPVILAATLPAQAGQSVLELGCGVGVASLCVQARVAGVSMYGLELQQEYADLARRNADENGANFTVYQGDLSDMPMDLRLQRFDHVIANPPYFDRNRGTASDHKARELAFGETTPLSDWVSAASKRLKPQGYLTIIQDAVRLPALMAALDETLGSLLIQPLTARDGRAAHRVILRARKGGRGDFRLLAPLVMHEGKQHDKDRDSYRAEFRAAFRHGEAIDFSAD